MIIRKMFVVLLIAGLKSRQDTEICLALRKERYKLKEGEDVL